MNVHDYSHLFAVPGSSSAIDFLNPTTGRSVINDETLTQIRHRYPNAEIVRFDEWQKEKAAAQDTPIEWTPTTAERYEEMLCVLPPAFWQGGLLLVGEPSDHHATSGAPRFTAYRQIGDSYLVASRPMTIKEAKVEVQS